jgi:hypothetical protein
MTALDQALETLWEQDDDGSGGCGAEQAIKQV